MSTKQIRDYLAKQIFIERNIVTYRSLSRQFSIHVNQAKNELAQFHQETQSAADKTAATFHLSGILKTQPRSNYASQSTTGDVDMDLAPSQVLDEDGYDDPEGEEVVEITVMLVNARDLEESKLGFDELHSEHVYSLSPAPINDADLVCTPTPAIREADRLGGTKLASTVGRIVGIDIKMKPGGQPIAGPSKLKPADSKPPLRTAASTPNLGGAHPSKGTTATSTANAPSSSDKGKEKQKVIAKGDFFKSAPKKAEPLKKAATLKNEPTATKPGSMFFGKSTKTAPVKAESPAPPALPKSNSAAAASSKPTTKSTTASPAPSAKSTSPEYDGPRGVKRKSSMGLDSGKGKTPATDKVSVKKRVIVSDDEEEEAPKMSRRNARRQEAISRMEDEEQRAALALMDVDDDMVEKVTRGPPSTVASALPSEDEMKSEASSPESQPDEDVQMADRQEEEEEEEEEVPKRKRAPKKPKKEIPVGRNGLKKKRVEKTRKVKDASGNIRIEDYSDWESVDEGEAPPEPKPKAKGKAAAKPVAKPVKKEPEEESVKVPEPTEKKPTTAAPKAKPKPKATGTGTKGKNQASMMQFFGKK